MFRFSHNLLIQSFLRRLVSCNLNFSQVPYYVRSFIQPHMTALKITETSLESICEKTLLLVNYRLYAVTYSLREKCPDTELFLVRIFLYLDTFHKVIMILFIQPYMAVLKIPEISLESTVTNFASCKLQTAGLEIL